ncbi:MAG: hypothetical protein JO108_17100 [Acidobacteriaceae bacterium]|nr:hypothetical protein [Acidobacteriaceae bacterium]
MGERDAQLHGRFLRRVFLLQAAQSLGVCDAYTTYDIAAMRLRLYGYIYPFIELGLGAA